MRDEKRTLKTKACAGGGGGGSPPISVTTGCTRRLIEEVVGRSVISYQ